MESYTWEKLNIKTRKPYTITKQRERWTEDEHNSFLEALKLYGRAWQRIEEHIGTKTAVQIRSHAQKFFTKLEKEAVAKGVPTGQALDMEIPPPRPKRKPNYPYPRKTRTWEAEKPATSVSSLQSLDLERKPLPEKTSHTENLESEKPSMEARNGIEDSQEAPCASLSLENENSIPNESFITIDTKKQDDIIESSQFAHENIIQGRYSDKPMRLIHDIQGKQTYPRHVPVQVVDVHQEVGAKTSVPLEMSFYESKVNKLGEVHEHPNPPNLFVNIAAASTSSGQHHTNASTYSAIPAFHHLCNPFQENYRSCLHVSSAHAAASFAAKFSHPVNTEASSADSFSIDQLNAERTPPSMTAIAAATVAAATAWWSAHGLLPVCTPFFPGGYSCTFVTPIDGNQARVDSTGREKVPSEGNLHQEKMGAENTESAADLSSSDETEKNSNMKERISVVEAHDSDKTNVGKQIDRSSCGSNSTSSSEMEMDVLEKYGKDKETKGSDFKESISHRGRSTINPNESWKGVSEEGRLAFRALFSREVLPQSFSDNPTVAETVQPYIKKNNEVNPNKMSQEPGESDGFVGEEGVLRMGFGSVNTGFRPYKRCAIESSKIVGAAFTGDKKGPKRICLGTEAST